MNNANDFVIENGVLKWYEGYGEKVIIPDGVVEISQNAFAKTNGPRGPYSYNWIPNDDLKEVTIPKSVKVIEKYAFNLCINLEKVTFLGADVAVTAAVFSACDNIKEISFAEDFFVTQSTRPTMFIPFVEDLSIKEMAYLLAFQDDKWFAHIQQRNPDANALARELIQALSVCEKIKPKGFERLVSFVEWAYPAITTENVKLICDAIKLKDEKVFVKFMKEKAVTRGLETDRITQETEEIEKTVAEYLKKNPLRPDATVFAKGVPYKGKDKNCPPLLLNVLVAEYLDLYDTNHKEIESGLSTLIMLTLKEDAIIPPIAEQIAEALEEDALSQTLEDMIYSPSKKYRPWMYAYARFATEESVEKLLRNAPKGAPAAVGYWKDNLTEALLLSDTKAAAEHLEKKGEMERYAHFRGLTVEEYRDKYSLPKWIMDEEVRICSAYGKYLYKVTKDFTLCAMDAKNCKTVRSISAKSEPESAAEFKQLKKDVVDFYKKRAEYIRKMYIGGEKLLTEHWLDTYCNNPILQPISEKVIWCDETGECFMCENGSVKTIDGEVYLPNEQVAVAHALEMSDKEISAWQEYLTRSGKKLLTEQVREPIASDINTDIFNGIVISKEERNEFNQNLNRKAISVRIETCEGEYDYGALRYIFWTTGTMLVGNALKIDYRINDETNETTLLKIYSDSDTLTRELNSVLLELNRTCIKALVRTDNAAALSDALKNTAALAQITEFIKIANENNATNVLAVLLDYKNANYADFDPVEEFTLDW